MDPSDSLNLTRTLKVTTDTAADCLRYASFRFQCRPFLLTARNVAFVLACNHSSGSSVYCFGPLCNDCFAHLRTGCDRVFGPWRRAVDRGLEAVQADRLLFETDQRAEPPSLPTCR